MSVFRSAITEKDGVSVNVGYLSLFWIMIFVLTVIPFMVAGACIETVYSERHAFPYAELGKGVGFVTAAFAAALGALGGFIWGDSQKDSANTTTTVTATTVAPTPAAAPVITPQLPQNPYG
jgi:hypothetical protein